MLNGKNVVLGVSGGIAAYKAVEVVRTLIKNGATVKVIMTSAAVKFITPLTFKTLTKQPVIMDLFDEDPRGEIYHISLSEEADVILIVPATANIIAKAANGIADDILSTTLLAANAPIIYAPSMNSKMYLNQATQKNIEQLKARGCRMVGPTLGELACGEKGVGRLAKVDAIIEAVKFEITRSIDLTGYSVLVTAGGTRESIDPVRFIGNRSSGKMGHAIANELAERGANTTLISTPTYLSAPKKVNFVTVKTALDMHKEVVGRFDSCNAVIMAAAVADFRPLKPHKEKIKKEQIRELNLRLTLNPDIIRDLGGKKKNQVLIAFAAESENLVENARRKLKDKRLDLIVANDISKPGIGFEDDFNQVVLIDKNDNVKKIPRMTKREIARKIVDRLVEMLKSQ
ncbi:MAG TPA: bifunctional phosphopantothenoylcysteine decarboxylase/phosphopantothenate--cysteine ligase CoaBC [Actinobacteria bacterium]|nr:bifunctional phosphopantothenoylcysteine decarboxylase/phosphopantothenate--cysteine ligase CoaBC [Actinomycetota bacterium]